MRRAALLRWPTGLVLSKAGYEPHSSALSHCTPDHRFDSELADVDPYPEPARDPRTRTRT